MLLDHIDIDKQNIFTPDGTIANDTIFEYCRLYEQRIESFGGIDIALLGIGRVGNIAFNEPGSRGIVVSLQVRCRNGIGDRSFYTFFNHSCFIFTPRK